MFHANHKSSQNYLTFAQNCMVMDRNQVSLCTFPLDFGSVFSIAMIYQSSLYCCDAKMYSSSDPLQKNGYKTKYVVALW